MMGDDGDFIRQCELGMTREEIAGRLQDRSPGWDRSELWSSSANAATSVRTTCWPSGGRKRLRQAQGIAPRCGGAGRDAVPRCVRAYPGCDVPSLGVHRGARRGSPAWRWRAACTSPTNGACRGSCASGGSTASPNRVCTSPSRGGFGDHRVDQRIVTTISCSAEQVLADSRAGGSRRRRVLDGVGSEKACPGRGGLRALGVARGADGAARHAIGQVEIAELSAARAYRSPAENIEEKTEQWGVTIIDVEITTSACPGLRTP